MNKDTIRKITMGGLIAALYYVLTVAVAPLSYGQVQCRLSEITLFFCMNNPFAVWGYTLGCVIANIGSPLGVIDMVIGGSANMIGGMIAHHTKKIVPTMIAVPIFYGVVVGSELSIVYGIPFIAGAASVALGELIALAIGAVFYTTIGKRIEAATQK